MHLLEWEIFNDRIYVGAFAGTSSHIFTFVNNACYRDPPGDVYGILVGEKYVYTLHGDKDNGYEGAAVRYDKKIELTSGSGRTYARAAMGLGLDAVSAVKHACKYDVHSGGRVHKYEDKK